MITKLIDKIQNNVDISKADAIELLNIEVGSEDYYRLLSISNEISRKQFKNNGSIFTQVGIDAQKCDVNCKFCSFAKDSYNGCSSIKSIEEVVLLAKKSVMQGAKEIFIMTTANFNLMNFLEYVKCVREALPPNVNLIVNTGDFNQDYAYKLKKLGVHGVYHICRLGEGIDTDVTVETRINTLDYIKNAGMEIYYCVEPIGPEHTYNQIADEIFRAKDYPVTVMAVMKRVAVEGTPLFQKGMITNAETSKIAAVTNICVRPKRAMGVHEPMEICLMSGCNQVYAEIGTNPRDIDENTEKNRGFSIQKAKMLLSNSGWTI
ncbi:MAG: radical SAM protein [Oscillospiraceae bacterium]